MVKPAKNTICLWYERDAEEAARFYAKTFPDSFVGAVQRAPGDFPSGKQGDVLTVEFTVMGIPCLGLNGGPEFKQSEAFSFQVATKDQAETDRYLERDRRQRRPRERVRLVQRQVGRLLADHADRDDQGLYQPRSLRRQAGVRCNDDDEKDRHRRDRGGSSLRRKLMKAIVFSEYGSPDVLKLTEVAKPTPKDNEILIKVHTTSVKLGDIWARNFKAISPSRFSMAFPFWVLTRLMFGVNKSKIHILGAEFAGEVEAVGNKVSLFKKGHCFDNAVSEPFFDTLKTEEVRSHAYGRGSYSTRRQAMTAIFDYLETFYNRTRPHSTLGFLSPFWTSRARTSTILGRWLNLRLN